MIKVLCDECGSEEQVLLDNCYERGISYIIANADQIPRPGSYIGVSLRTYRLGKDLCLHCLLKKIATMTVHAEHFAETPYPTPRLGLAVTPQVRPGAPDNRSQQEQRLPLDSTGMLQELIADRQEQWQQLNLPFDGEDTTPRS